MLQGIIINSDDERQHRYSIVEAGICPLVTRAIPSDINKCHPKFEDDEERGDSISMTDDQDSCDSSENQETEQLTDEFYNSNEKINRVPTSPGKKVKQEARYSTN